MNLEKENNQVNKPSSLHVLKNTAKQMMDGDHQKNITKFTKDVR